MGGSFAWLGRCRRLSKDYEELPENRGVDLQCHDETDAEAVSTRPHFLDTLLVPDFLMKRCKPSPSEYRPGLRALTFAAVSRAMYILRIRSSTTEVPHFHWDATALRGNAQDSKWCHLATKLGIRGKARALMGGVGGVPGRIRTRDPLLRRQPLYPLSYWDTSWGRELALVLFGRPSISL